jgi:ankyrin repeat protein
MADVLIEALRSGKLSAVRAAIKAAPEKARHARNVVEAGRRAFQKAFELLQKNGADLNAIWRGYRPLHALLQEDAHAAAGKPTPERLACLDWLLQHGADPEQLGAWPAARAIIIAAFVGEPEYVKRLKKAGAKMDGFAAAASGDLKSVEKALRQHPEFARARDSGGLTALQCAAGSRYPGANTLDIARLLLDAGADLKAKTKSWNHDVDAMYFAASSKNKAMFELFLNRGGDPTEALVHALWGPGEEFAEIALAHGAEPDRAVAEGKPLLNHLIQWGQIKPALWLLTFGASPNIADPKQAWTAAHQAASRGNARMMRAVIDAGADLARRDKQGYTPPAIARIAGRAKLLEMMGALR